METQKYLDFHSHSTDSDGALPVRELICQARDCGVRIMAVTDHNYTGPLQNLRREFPDMTLVQGAEFSCRWIRPDGQDQELHVVGLGFDPDHPAIQAVLRQNQPDRRPYIEAIINRLREYDIDVGDYDFLRDKFPETKHLGRKQIAMVMEERGYVKSCDEAFDRYIGGFGLRLAFVKNPLTYVTLETAVQAILEAGGYPVLCHLYYYRMSEENNRLLLKRFRELAGDRGAMEVYYGAYTPQQRQILKSLAAEFSLMCSAASDFHSNNGFDGETLDNRFLPEDCRPLLECLGIQVAE